MLRLRWFNLSSILSILIASLVAIPIATLLLMAVEGALDADDARIWAHISSTVLPNYLFNSLILSAGVTIGVTFIGVGSAYLISSYQFPGSKTLSWALLLPLAMPTYITAYAYTGIFEVSGPIQTSVRTVFDVSVGEYWFPEIRSLGGAVLVFSFVLYPYVYLLVRTVLLYRSSSIEAVTQTLGYGKHSLFRRLTLPMIRPALVAGVALALMETLADYGAVSFFGIDTFTTGIFRTWNGLGSVSAAAQLSLILLAFVWLLLFFERQSRRRVSFARSTTRQTIKTTPLCGWRGFTACCFAALPLVLGFLLPVSQLVHWSFTHQDPLGWSGYVNMISNSIWLASLTALFACLLVSMLAYLIRHQPNSATQLSRNAVAVGYAIPGAVVAVGAMVPLSQLDHWINDLTIGYFDQTVGLVFSGSIAALLIGYLVRFMTVALNSVEAGMSMMPLQMDKVAKTLGLGWFRIFTRVHIPMLRPSVFAAALLVFVEVMKELPATLIMRPFNFNTLAVRAYELAADERLPEAASSSLAIVIIGLLPLILLNRVATRNSTAS